MGKSRSRAAKTASVFRIARSGAVKAKTKGKARPVTSGLKQINIRNAEKVSTINKAFAEVQKEVQHLSKSTAAEPQKSQKASTNLEDGTSKCRCCHKPAISVVMHNGQWRVCKK